MWALQLPREIRYAWRAVSKRPLLSILAIATLAIGIGACTAAFTLLDVIAFRSLPVRDPDRLVQLSSINEQNRVGYIASSALDIIDRADVFEGTCAFLTPLSTIEIDGRVQPIATLALSGGCFELLGVRPAAGRLFGPVDDAPGVPNVAVISHDTWHRDFSGRLDAIGHVIVVEGEPFTIVGVTERRFTGLQVGFPSRVMVPLVPQAFQPASLRRLRLSAYAFARLPPTVAIEQANQRLQTLWPEILKNSVSEDYQTRQRTAYLASRVQVAPAATGLGSVVRMRFRVPLIALMGIAVIVLAAASLNVANLLLARALERRREHAIRAAIGASRRRLVLEAAWESALLLGPAIALGSWLAYGSVNLLLSVYAATNSNFGLDVTPDARTVMFVCTAAAGAWLCFALGPIAAVGSANPASALATGSFGTTARRIGTRRALLVVQVALTLVLVACATWFAAMLRELRAAPLGYDDEILAARLAPVPGGYDSSFESSVYYRRLLDSVATLPGIRVAALTNAALPIAAAYRASATPVDRPELGADVQVVRVSDGFFTALQLPLVLGSDFSRSDQPTGARTAIVSVSLARRLFGSEQAVGRHIAVGTLPADQALQIVGVAADATLSDPRIGSQPTVYLNYWQQDAAFQQFPVLLVRSDTALADVAPGLRSAIARNGREYPLGIQRVADNLDNALIQEQLLSITSLLLATIGLLQAAVGLFGLTSVTVTSRTREFGIRLAVGATRAEIFRLACGEMGLAVTMGIVAGLPLMWVAGRLLSALLQDTAPFNVVAVIATVAIVAVTGLIASWLPANRATKIDALTALRFE